LELNNIRYERYFEQLSSFVVKDWPCV